MAPLLQSATTPTDGSAIVTVRGDLDTDTATQLWQYLGYLIGQGHHHIVLDLRGMILIDSAGVDVLTRASAWTRREGGDLVLRSASRALAEQLELARRAEAHRRHPSTGTGHQPDRTTVGAAGPGPAADGGHPWPVRPQTW
jgi:anti-anti-sigma factor